MNLHHQRKMELDLDLLRQGASIKALYCIGKISGDQTIKWEVENLVGFFRHSKNCNFAGEEGIKVSGEYGYAGYDPHLKLYTRYAVNAHSDGTFPGGKHVLRVLQVLGTKKPLPSSVQIGQLKKKIAKYRRKLNRAEDRLETIINESLPTNGRVEIRVRQGARPQENQRFDFRDTLHFEGDGFDDAMANVFKYYSALRDIPGTRVIITRAEKRKLAKIREAIIHPIACQLDDLYYLSSGHDGSGLHCHVYEHGKGNEDARCYPYYPECRSTVLQSAVDGWIIPNMAVQYVLLPPVDLKGTGEKWEICTLIERTQLTATKNNN